jgi:hypothetical protein
MHASSITMYVSNLKRKILEAAKLDQQYVQEKVALQKGKL